MPPAIRFVLPCLFLAATFAPAPASAGDSLVLVTEDAPPFNMAKPGSGEVVGIATDLLKRALTEASISYSISLEPWPRAFAMAQSHIDTCLYSTNWTEQRAGLFKWVGPLVTDRWALFGRRGSAKLASLDEAKGRVIGGYFGDAAAGYLKNLGFRIDEVADVHLNPKRLNAGRIDYWANGLTSAPFLAHQAGVNDLVPVLLFKETNLSLACNKAVPDQTIDRLNAIIHRMHQDGTYAAIEKSYQ